MQAYLLGLCKSYKHPQGSMASSVWSLREPISRTVRKRLWMSRRGQTKAGKDRLVSGLGSPLILAVEKEIGICDHGGEHLWGEGQVPSILVHFVDFVRLLLLFLIGQRSLQNMSFSRFFWSSPTQDYLESLINTNTLPLEDSLML